MANVLMIVGDFNEDLEVRFPQQALEMLGHAVHTVSPGQTCRLECGDRGTRSGRLLTSVVHRSPRAHAAGNARLLQNGPRHL